MFNKLIIGTMLVLSLIFGGGAAAMPVVVEGKVQDVQLCQKLCNAKGECTTVVGIATHPEGTSQLIFLDEGIDGYPESVLIVGKTDENYPGMYVIQAQIEVDAAFFVLDIVSKQYDVSIDEMLRLCTSVF